MDVLDDEESVPPTDPSLLRPAFFVPFFPLRLLLDEPFPLDFGRFEVTFGSSSSVKILFLNLAVSCVTRPRVDFDDDAASPLFSEWLEVRLGSLSLPYF